MPSSREEQQLLAVTGEATEAGLPAGRGHRLAWRLLQARDCDSPQNPFWAAGTGSIW
jgi:hypothetical protein